MSSLENRLFFLMTRFCFGFVRDILKVEVSLPGFFSSIAVSNSITVFLL